MYKWGGEVVEKSRIHCIQSHAEDQVFGGRVNTEMGRVGEGSVRVWESRDGEP